MYLIVKETLPSAVPGAVRGLVLRTDSEGKGITNQDSFKPTQHCWLAGSIQVYSFDMIPTNWRKSFTRSLRSHGTSTSQHQVILGFGLRSVGEVHPSYVSKDRVTLGQLWGGAGPGGEVSNALPHRLTYLGICLQVLSEVLETIFPERMCDESCPAKPADVMDARF